MRKISSFALTFAFVLPLAGCPGDDSGTTTDAMTTAPTTTDEPTTTAPTTDEPTTDEPTTTAPTTTADTGSTTDPTAGAGGFCGLICEAAADCAMGGNEADWACTDGFCEYIADPPACDDTTCPAAAGAACADVDGVNICTFPCTDGGGECDAFMLECTGTDDAGNSICQGAPCGGVAEGEACEIPMFGQLGTCTDGVCSCSDDAECTADGYACNN